jgi:hypothetical protein
VNVLPLLVQVDARHLEVAPHPVRVAAFKGLPLNVGVTASVLPSFCGSGTACQRGTGTRCLRPTRFALGALQRVGLPDGGHQNVEL